MFAGGLAGKKSDSKEGCSSRWLLVVAAMRDRLDRGTNFPFGDLSLTGAHNSGEED